MFGVDEIKSTSAYSGDLGDKILLQTKWSKKNLKDLKKIYIDQLKGNDDFAINERVI